MENTRITIHIDLVIFLIFLILKLDGIINWKWIWVFSPIWITFVIQNCIVIILAIKNRKPKYKPYAVFGDPLIWDAKTNTMYGPFENE